ncbi:hypothetical protein CQW23_00479 [Capsicum baccatum]|uniref:DUF4094 domain-containing protein n=1 Tax=Capsicum baccatum TaxID=33114 RepID=A0A2G2XKV8_CAPBA|nr:hypothetical protein CQW23_00479 [Capsicum baccatum]
MGMDREGGSSGSCNYFGTSTGSGQISKDKYYYGFFNAALKLPAHFTFGAVVAFYNVGVHYDTWNSGVLGPVTLSGLNVGSRDLAKKKKVLQGGLKVGSGSRSPQYKAAGLSTRRVSLLCIAYFCLGVFVVNRLLTVSGPVRMVNDDLSVEHMSQEFHPVLECEKKASQQERGVLGFIVLQNK